MPLLVEFMPSMEVSTAHANAAMKPEEYFDLFSALAMVYGLLADALTNEMVDPVNKASANKAIRFLAE